MMRIKRCVLSIVALLAALGARPADAQRHDTSNSGELTQQMQQFIAVGEIAGAVTLVATADEILHLDASGLADVDSQRPMQPDSIFWIASMTKPITGTAIMMLHDEGRLSVDDSIAKHLPEFRELRTADGTAVDVTIKQLLTHTSGLGEISPAEAREARTLADVTPLYASKPVRFAPGSQWAYCQSGINTAARIVEVVSGKSFVDFLDERLFGPLGMKDTTFYLSDEQALRLATSYRRIDGADDGAAQSKLEVADISILYGKEPTSLDRFPAANGGLFSTAPDYARFCQMILGGGEFAGRRFLSRAAVRQMTSVHTSDLRTGFTPGNGWGLGWCIVREPQGVTAVLSPGTFGHGGAYGTQAWIDPEKERIYILMVQRANFPNSDASDVRKAFQEAAAR